MSLPFLVASLFTPRRKGGREPPRQRFNPLFIRAYLLTPHSLRHTAITKAVKRGAPVQKGQAMARHANISTTMIYYHETDRVENPAEEYIQYNGNGGGMR
mgnify:CR=1 FL=1